MTEEERRQQQDFMNQMLIMQLMQGGGGSGMSYNPMLTEDQRRQQAGMLGAASLFDIIQGSRAQKQGEEQKEMRLLKLSKLLSRRIFQDLHQRQKEMLLFYLKIKHRLPQQN